MRAPLGAEEVGEAQAPLLLRRSSTRGSSSGLQEAPEKKHESRRSGFFSLIKSRTSRSERSHGAAAASSTSAAAPPPLSTSCVSTVTEEASPPPAQQELHPDHAHSVTEEAWPAGEAAEEKEVQQEDVEEEKNTLIRHGGVAVMGVELLAEMKARQEKMALKKVRGELLLVSLVPCLVTH